MLCVLSFVLGSLSGYVFYFWWIRPDIIDLKNEVQKYERLKEARIQRGIDILKVTKAKQDIEIDND